ncbi:MAG: hypothetical protein ACK5RM_02695, partial [Pseudanabaena sp.]
YKYIYKKNKNTKLFLCPARAGAPTKLSVWVLIKLSYLPLTKKTVSNSASVKYLIPVDALPDILQEHKLAQM